MKNLNIENKASFQFNDMAYEAWYDQQYDFSYDEIKDIDNQKGLTMLSKNVVDYLNDEFSCNLSFVSLYQPKEYNFESDKITVEYTPDCFDKIMQGLKEYDLLNTLNDEVKEVTTSCSGYTAFYSFDEIKGNTDHFLSLAIEVFLFSEHSDYEGYFDRTCFYDHLLECITYIYNDVEQGE